MRTSLIDRLAKRLEKVAKSGPMTPDALGYNHFLMPTIEECGAELVDELVEWLRENEDAIYETTGWWGYHTDYFIDTLADLLEDNDQTQK